MAEWATFKPCPQGMIRRAASKEQTFPAGLAVPAGPKLAASTMAANDIPLFSYGTLQMREVQLANYGRPLEGSPDALIGYRMEVLPDRDPDAVRVSGTKTHMVVRRTGDPSDRVAGVVFLLTAEELASTDRYEGSDYGRAELTLESGRRALVYVEA